MNIAIIGEWNYNELNYYINNWIESNKCYLFNILCGGTDETKVKDNISYKWAENNGAPKEILVNNDIDKLLYLLVNKTDYAFIKKNKEEESNKIICNIIMKLSIAQKHGLVINQRRFYTTYFARIKEIEKIDGIPIAICGKSPDWYYGLEYKKLAPKYKFFKEWQINKNNEYYIKHYYDEVLNLLNPIKIFEELEQKVNNKNKDIYLVCYEKPLDFCHRHLVSQWLRNNGIWIEEKEWEEIKK